MQVDFQQVLSQLREENRTIEASNPILSDGGAVTFTFIDLPYDSTPQDASHPDRSEFLTDKRQTADLKKTITALSTTKTISSTTSYTSPTTLS